MPYLLDTNICVHFINGEFDLAAKIDAVGLENCFISSVTIAELLYGVANSAPARQANNRQNLMQLRQLFNGRILTFESALETYAIQRAQLKRISRLQGEFDMLIGSTALAHGLTLVTRNTRHFASIANLALENWIDNESTPILPPSASLARPSSNNPE